MSWCGLHGHDCDCAYHCTGCRHSYGPLRSDCCSCCRERRTTPTKDGDQ